MASQKDRPSHYSGTLKIDVPGYDDVEYGFGTGGSGRGSVPYGSYPISDYYHRTPKGLQGWAVNNPSGTIADPKYKTPRTSIMIHPDQLSVADKIITAGCIGIAKNQWATFRQALKEVTQKFGGAIIDVSATGNAIIRPPGSVPKSQLAASPKEIIDNFGTLKAGAQNPPERVKALQEQLAAAGLYDGAIDGVYGKNTAKAVKAQQARMNEQLKSFGLDPVDVDGKWGAHSNSASISLGLTAPKDVSLEARDELAAARQAAIKMPSRISTPESLRLNGLAEEYARRPPAPQGITGSVMPSGDVGASINMRASPVAAPRLTGSVAPGPADLGADVRMGLSPVAPPRLTGSVTPGPADMGASTRMGLSPVSPGSSGDPRLDLVRKALRPVGPEGGISTPADPRGWGPIAANRMAGIGRADAPIPRMNPRRGNLAGSGWDDATVAPEKGNPMNPTRNTRPGWGNAMDAQRAAADAPRRVPTTSISYDVRKSRPQVGVSDMVRTAGAAEAAARRSTADMASRALQNYDSRQGPAGAGRSIPGPSFAPDPGEMSRNFGIMSYASDVKNQSRHPGLASPVANVFNKATTAPPSPPAQVAAAPQRAVPEITLTRPASIAPLDIRPAFSAPKRVLTDPAALSPAQAAIAARYSGLAAQYAAKPPPAYTPTSPVAAPIQRPNPLAAPQAMAASVVPAMPAPVPPKFIGLPKAVPLAASLLTGIPIGLGISALNKIMGAGYKQSTAAQNARVSAGVQASDLIGGAYGNASYGRKQSDGSVTGTTRSGTGYTSRDGGREISVGGRSYTAKKDGRGYAQRIG